MIDETGTYEDPEPVEHGGRPASEATQQMVVFTLGELSYCVDIMWVREIRAWSDTTDLPNTADFVCGVINLRGAVIPIIDLRKRFGQGETDPTKTHVVVIVAIDDKLNGILVDTVSDILSVGADDVRAIPDTDGEAQHAVLDGLVTQKDRMVGLIALERLVDQSAVH